MNQSRQLISIDFWDTIVQAGSGGEQRNKIRIRAVREVAGRYDIELEKDKIADVYGTLSNHFHDIWFNEHRTLPPRIILRMFTKELGFDISDSDLEYLFAEYEKSFLSSPPELIKGADSVITELAGNFKLAIISDTMVTSGKTLRKYLDELNLLSCFSSFLFSDEAGYSKPDKRAFEFVLNECSCPAEGSSHLGDRLNTDIKGAKSVGMKAGLFTGAADRSNELDGDFPEPDYIFKSWSDVGNFYLP